MDRRRQRALKKTLLVAIFLSIPVGFLIYFKIQNQYQEEVLSYYKVKPFYLQTTEQVGVSLSDLRNKVTLLAIVPSKSLGKQELMQVLTRAQEWANEQLGNKNQKPFQLIALTETSEKIPEQWVQIELGEDQVFAQEVEPFLEGGLEPDDLSLVFIDQNAVVKGVFDYSQIGDWGEVEALWSRLVFNHYLTDYLSKRTFFGPKRDRSLQYY
ncbi:MAG: hypothetical protein HRU09_09240 [Oligoflexales bacterium]|nr:hypothetical protein [Oligoflexales bacterium]